MILAGFTSSIIIVGYIAFEETRLKAVVRHWCLKLPHERECNTASVLCKDDGEGCASTSLQNKTSHYL